MTTIETPVSVSERLMTADELLALPDDGYHRYELDRGRLVCMVPSAWLPGVIASELVSELRVVVKRDRLGVVGTADSGMLLTTGPDTVRAPNAWFVHRDRIPAGGPPIDRFWPGAPDLAVEVLSPSDRYRDVMLKVQDYLTAGSRLVWVVDPGGRSAAVFRAGGGATLMGEEGVLDGEDLLPGFRLPLADLFDVSFGA
jgi:Uma2 family endonuclease